MMSLDLLKRIFLQDAVYTNQIRQNIEHETQKRQYQKDGANQKRLQMAALMLQNIKQNQVAHEWNQTDYKRGVADGAEHHVRPVHNVRPGNRRGGLEYVLPHIFEQARFARFRIGRDRNARNGQPLVAGLDDGFHAVAELRNDIQPDERFARIGPEAAGRVGQLGAGGFVDDEAAEALQRFFKR